MCDQDTVLKVLDCPVCLRAFNQPRLLPCGHTLCVRCITPLVRGSKLSCPECRKPHKVPVGGVENFPPNPVVISLLDTLCKGCRRVKPEADCGHCGQRLCQACITGHHGHEEVTTLLGSLDITVRQAMDVMASAEPVEKTVPVMQELDMVALLMHQEVNDQIEVLKSFIQTKIKMDIGTNGTWVKNTNGKLTAAQTYYNTAMEILGEEYSNSVEDHEMKDITTRSEVLKQEVQVAIAQVPSVSKIRLKFNTDNMFQLSKFARLELEVDQSKSVDEHTEEGANGKTNTSVATVGAAASQPEILLDGEKIDVQ